MRWGFPDEDLDAAFAIVGADAWTTLERARIFITGGTGYVGKWLLAGLLEADRRLDLGCRTTVLSRNPAGFAAEEPELANGRGIELAVGDVRDFAAPDGAFSHVIHAAADVIANKSAVETMSVAMEGTRRVLDLSVQRGATRFLLTSSGAVYGPHPGDLGEMPEDFAGAPPLDDPHSAYGEGKRVAEWLTHTIARENGIDAMVARLYAQVGPRLPLVNQFAMGNFIRDALTGTRTVIKGDGTPVRTFLYGSDLSGWLWAMLLRGDGGLVCNVGSPEEVTIGELAQRVNAVLGSTAGVEIRGQAIRGAAPSRYVPDVSRIRTALGLPAPVGLDDAIRRTGDWYRGRGVAG